MHRVSDSNRNSKNQVLNIKITLPVIRNNIITRSVLLDTLKVRHSNLPYFILVSAPPGYGKTTLLADWIKKNNLKHIWITLDKHDNDPVFFLQSFACALKKTHKEIGLSIESLLGSPQLSSAEYIGYFISELFTQAAEPVIIVLDDYHVIENAGIHNIMKSFLNSLPRTTGVVVSTREDPPFPLSGLRVKNQLLEIRANNLSFSRQEIKDFICLLSDIQLEKGLINIIKEKTEGWAASIQLLGLVLQESTEKDVKSIINKFDGTNKYIIDYLIEEVLKDQSEEIVDFFYVSSITDSFTAGLCDYLRGKNDSEKIISKLGKENILITADPNRTWFRYHHLFSEFLKSQHNPEDKKKLYARAYEWFLSKKLNFEAIKYCLLSGDTQNAVALIKQEMPGVFRNGEYTIIYNWLKDISKADITGDFEMLVYNMWVLFFLNKKQKLNFLMKEYEPDILNHSKDGIKGRFKTLQAWICDVNNSDDTKKISKQALQLLDDDDSEFKILALFPLSHSYYREGKIAKAADVLKEAYETGREVENLYIATLAVHNLVFLLNDMAKNQEAEKLCHHMIKLNSEKYSKHTPLNGLLFISLSMVYYESNQLHLAYTYAEKGLELCKNLDFDYILAQRAETILALVEIARGNIEEAFKILNSIEIDPFQVTFTRSYEILTCIEAEISFKMGKYRKIKEWTDQVDAENSALNSIIDQRILFVYFRYQFSINKIDDAEKNLDLLLHSAEQKKYWRNLITIYILKAILANIKGQEAETEKYLKKAVLLAETGNYIRAFLNEGRIIVILLSKIRSLSPGFIDKIIRESKKSPHKLEAKENDLAEYESLSKRELEILRLIQDGLSNKEISETLFISTGTVKWHINNIFLKLDVKSRTQAIKAAKKLSILS